MAQGYFSGTFSRRVESDKKFTWNVRSGSFSKHWTARANGNRVELRVVDYGPGIPAAGRKRMFQPFCRLGALGDSTGVGLGLAVARGLPRR
jgi:signal transduction histidine kinase